MKALVLSTVMISLSILTSFRLTAQTTLHFTDEATIEDAANIDGGKITTFFVKETKEKKPYIARIKVLTDGAHKILGFQAEWENLSEEEKKKATIIRRDMDPQLVAAIEVITSQEVKDTRVRSFVSLSEEQPYRVQSSEDMIPLLGAREITEAQKTALNEGLDGYFLGYTDSGTEDFEVKKDSEQKIKTKTRLLEIRTDAGDYTDYNEQALWQLQSLISEAAKIYSSYGRGSQNQVVFENLPRRKPSQQSVNISLGSIGSAKDYSDPTLAAHPGSPRDSLDIRTP